MAQPGEYAELLRTLGNLLDRDGAAGITVVDLGHAWSVAWREGAAGKQTRTWHHFDLGQLRAEAIAQRQEESETPALGYGEILRTIGRRCDQEELQLAAIIEEQGSYRIAGVRRGTTTVWGYAEQDIIRLVEEQRVRRQESNPPP